VSKKPLEVRHGFRHGRSGTLGSARQPAASLFEIDGVPLTIARESLALAAAKLPIKTRLSTESAVPNVGVMMKPADLSGDDRRLLDDEALS